MPSKYISLVPLDDQGMRLDRPANEVKWTNLTNVLFDDGRLIRRPGFFVANGRIANDLSGYIPSAPVAIGEIIHPGTTITGRTSTTYVVETLFPDATTSTDWTVNGAATAHEALDDTVPDDATTNIASTTDGDVAIISFDTAATTPEILAGTLVRGRARTTDINKVAHIKFEFSGGGTTTTVPVVLGEFGEGEFWQDFAFFLPDYNGSNATVTITAEAAVSSGHFSIFIPNADGSDTDWGSKNDFDQRIGWEDRTETGVTSTGDGTRQSFTIGTFAASPVTPIRSVQPRFAGDLSLDQAGSGTVGANVRIFWVNSVGTRVYLETDNLNTGYFVRPRSDDATQLLLRSTRADDNITYFLINGDILTLNPETGLAWTETEVENSEWGIEYVSGKGTVTLVRADVKVEHDGYDTPTLQLTSLTMDLMSVTNNNQASMASGDRWFLTTHEGIRATGQTKALSYADTGSALSDLSTGINFPLDHTVLFGQVFAVNGLDQTMFYPDGSNLWSAFSGKPTGRTITAFADRLLVGWVNDSGTITPERVAYSARNDGTDYTATTAGDFDLIRSPGGVVKLLALTDDLCVGYKEVGIYNIRETGNVIAPLVNDMIDRETGCLARMTVKAALTPSGQPYHIFLGRNNTEGISVFSYNGAEVSNIGAEIAPQIATDADFDHLSEAFSEVDPQTQSYWLFIAQDGEVLPKLAYVMDLKTGVWTRQTFPWEVSCAGVWSMTDSTASNVLDGTRKMLVGVPQLLDAAVVDFTESVDSLHNRGLTEGTPNSDTERTLQDVALLDNERFESVIETGDILLDLNYVGAYRLHIIHENAGGCPLKLSTSVDGGITYNTEIIELIGNDNTTKNINHTILEFTPSSSKRVRIKIETDVGAGSDGDIYRAFFKINEMYIEYEDLGDST